MRVKKGCGDWRSARKKVVITAVHVVVFHGSHQQTIVPLIMYDIESLIKIEWNGKT